MRKIVALAVLFINTFVMVAQDRRFSPTGGTGRRLALIIGNDAYPWKPLTNAVNDARSVAALLPQAGFLPADVTLVTNADLKQMKRAGREFIERLRPDDLAFVYFSGHGVEVRGENFLIPVDFPADATELEVQDEGYSAQQLLRNLEATQAKTRIFILDACRNNPLRATRSTGGGLARMDGRGTLIVFATSAGATAADTPQQKNGLFATHLLRNLLTPGLPLGEMITRVAREVDRDSGSKQTPAIYGLLLEDFPLVAGTASAPTHFSADTEAWELVKTSQNPEDFDEFARNFPDSDLARAAKMRAAQLRRSTAPLDAKVSAGTGSETLAAGKTFWTSKQFDRALPLFRTLAETGNAEAADYMGDMYEYGRGGLPKDLTQALSWYRRAESGGNIHAKASLGAMYLNGLGGLPRDAEQAAKLFREAANGGDARGMNGIGVMYEGGLGGLSKDPGQAVAWYFKAASGGDVHGMVHLGDSYGDGIGGLQKDPTKAVFWYRKAAEAGYGPGMTSLGYMYEIGSGGLPKDDAQAVAWYRHAAEVGEAPGMTNLGYMYQVGRGGLPKDDVQAVTWYRNAANAGGARGMTNLGYMYAAGRGGLPKDDAQAVAWYQKAADVGYGPGMTNLGYMYETGSGGLPKDEIQAVTWYRKAAEAGDPVGMTNLGVMYESGRGGLPKDDSQAVAWYRKAVDAGDPHGMFNLGVMYENGRGGLPKDVNQAAAWYRKAADAGDTDAKSALVRLGR